MQNKIHVFYPVVYLCFMDYIELDCRVIPAGENTEILIAYLGELGYTMFEETDYGVKAYINKELFNREEINTIPLLNKPGVTVEVTVSVPETKNWNEEWEKNFQPVIIGNEIYVRADYHPASPDTRFELIIHPRMAFGTGHHATTSLVMEAMLKIDFHKKKVLDMGCGTGILAILAGKMGASSVLAIDNDPNAVENAIVNCEINHADGVEVQQGDAQTPGDSQFEVILANINRNIILDDIALYTSNLTNNGILITSGYYVEDLPLIREKAKLFGLSYSEHSSLDNWCRTSFVKGLPN